MISIQLEATFFGPNPFAHNPLLVASLTIDEETPDVSGALEQACFQLRAGFPEWFRDNHPQGTVAETVALTGAHWALGALNEVRGFLHDAGAVATPEGARLWLGFHHPRISLSAIQLALQVLIHAARSNTFELRDAESGLDALWRFCRKHHPDYQARILMEGARAQGIPVLPFIVGKRYWQFGWGSRSLLFFESMSNACGQLGYQLQHSKVLGKEVFAALGFSTPDYLLVNRSEELAMAAEKIGWPCVVKPLSSGGGKGVTAGIRSMPELEAAFDFARRYTDEAVMIERFAEGHDHRLMVIDNKLFAAIRREASAVTGDGRSTVFQLLEALNRNRSANIVKSRYLRPIDPDKVLGQHLAQQGVALDTVPEAGRRITLRSNANLSTGGVCIDVTDRVHPHIRQMAETVARTMGLSTAGIDFITTDIEKSCRDCGTLIEVNTTPSLDVMIAAGQKPASVALAVLGAIPARIPVRLIVVRQSLLEQAEAHLKSRESADGSGWSCNGSAAVDGMPLCITSSAPWSAVRALLRHKVVSQVTVVCTAEEIMRHGLPVDKADRVVLCCGESELPDEWLQVMTACSMEVERAEDWNEYTGAEL